MKALKETSLEKKEDRLRLKQQKHPHYTLLFQDCHLGYYKGSKRGSWVVRWLDQKTGNYKFETLGKVDDFQAANGENILSYSQAKHRAEQFILKQQEEAYEDEIKSIGIFGETAALDQKTMGVLNVMFDYIDQVKLGNSEPLKGFRNEINKTQNDDKFAWLGLNKSTTNHGYARKYLKMLREK